MNEIGELLKKHRILQNKTIPEISNKTKISNKYLEAIEEGNFKLIPGGEVYVKGFIKNYAETVGLNGKEIISMYNNLKKESEIDNDGKLEYNNKSEKLKKSKVNSQKVYLKPLILIIIILIISLVVYKSYDIFDIFINYNNNNFEQSENQMEEEETEKYENSLDNQEQLNDEKDSSEVDFNIVKNDNTITHYIINNPPVIQFEVLSNYCWVRVISDDNVVFEGNLFSQNTKVWEAQEELIIRIGNPKIVSIELNGIDLGIPGGDTRNFVFEYQE